MAEGIILGNELKGAVFFHKKSWFEQYVQTSFDFSIQV